MGLLFGLLFHALNGLRIILIDFFPEAVRNDKVLFGVVLFLTIGATAPGAVVIMRPAF